MIVINMRSSCILKLLLLSFLVSGCGGGGGGSSSQDPDSLPQVLTFDSISYRYINDNSVEVVFESGRVWGEVRSGYGAVDSACDQSNVGSSVTVLSIDWRNELNSAQGQSDVIATCRPFTGWFLGFYSDYSWFTQWVTGDIPLDIGDNRLTFDTYDGGRQIGRDSILVTRNEPVQPVDNTLGDQAVTVEGTWQGTVEDGLSVFRGVRYAAAPSDNLRFKPPQDPPHFSGIEDATQFREKCIQPAGTDTVGSEDCLWLNIWGHNDDIVRPAIVFLHGGDRNGVGGDMPVIDGSQLAKGADAVVITLNRRLGVMGYLALDELIQENSRLTAGNYGLLDTIFALRWIQSNIAAFNGDPERVLLAGESAGAFAICHILAAPEAEGLFHAVTLQSGNCGQRMLLHQQINETSRFASAVELHRPLLAEVGCETSADIPTCLRQIDAGELVRAAGRIPRAAENAKPFIPIIDEVIVQTNPYDALGEDLVGSIPLIVGSNENELDLILENVTIPDASAYSAILDSTFGNPESDYLFNLYPPHLYSTAKAAYLTLMNDYIFSCVAEELANSARNGNYLYLLRKGFSNGILADQGAVHGIDVAYLFGTFDVFGYTPDADALMISEAMQQAWGSFAASPNAPPSYLPDSFGVTAWPEFVGSGNFVSYGKVTEFDDAVSFRNRHRDERCLDLRSIVNL